jgi:hypothetical protein
MPCKEAPKAEQRCNNTPQLNHRVCKPALQQLRRPFSTSTARSKEQRAPQVRAQQKPQKYDEVDTHIPPPTPPRSSRFFNSPNIIVGGLVGACIGMFIYSSYVSSNLRTNPSSEAIAKQMWLNDNERGSVLYYCHIGVHALKPAASCIQYAWPLGLWTDDRVVFRYSVISGALFRVCGCWRFVAELYVDEEEAVESWRPGGFWRSVGRFRCHGVLDALWDSGVPFRAYADVDRSCLDGGDQRWRNAGSSSLDAYFWSCRSSGRNGLWGFVVAGCNEERQTSSEIGCLGGLW